MKNVKLILITCFTVSLSFMNSYAQEVFQNNRLTKIWETKPGLITPESVIYDAETKTIFVSNVNDKPWEKDGNGFISKLSVNGDILDLKWAKDMDAPKGLVIYKGKLFVTNIDEVVEIDITTAKILNRYKNPRAKNLNDITVDKEGTVYVSDSGDKCIYVLKKGKLDLWLENVAIAGVNGLWVEEKRLLAGLPDKVVAIDLKTKEISKFVDNTGGIDGLVPEGDGYFLISDWKGNVNEIRQGSPILKLLNTTPKQVNAADIWFIMNDRILLIPTFFANKIVAYTLAKP